MRLTKLLITVALLSAVAFANLDDAIDTMGKELQQSLLNKKSKMIAVIDFNNLDNSVNNLGRHISEKLAIKLFRLNKDNSYTIVERGQLSKILKELKLSASGLVEPKTMKKIGKIYGVDTVISGSLTDLGNDIEIKVKALSVETGGMMGVSESKIPKTNMVKNLYTQNLVEGQYTTVEGKKVTTLKGGKTTTISKKPNGKYVFENDEISIEFHKIKRRDFVGISSIETIVYYKNKTTKPLTIQISDAKTYISDNVGIKWNNEKNTLFKKDKAIIIDGGRKLISKSSFTTRDIDTSATTYSIHAYYSINEKNIELKIYDIPQKLK